MFDLLQKSLIRPVVAMWLVVVLFCNWIPPVLATSTFANANSYIKIKNVTAGDASYAVTTNGTPGDAIRYSIVIKNTGADPATNVNVALPLSNITYTPRTAFAGWGTSTFSLNNNTGEVMLIPLYVDSDSSGTVTNGDKRINRYGINSTSNGGKYAEGSTVACAGDYDCSTALTTAVTDIYITGGNGTWDGTSEIAYAKGSNNVTTADVQIGDIRINTNGSYQPGSTVVSGDTDICTGCLTQATNIKRLSDGSGDTLWPFDGTGFPIGDLGVNKTMIITVTGLTINTSTSSNLTSTLTVSASNASPSSSSYTATININSSPSVSGVTFTPGTISNNGTDTTKITATISDPNGLSDISTVTANLSGIGGSSTTTLYDNGTNGDTTSGDGVYSKDSISTTSAANTYSISVTATDTANKTGTASNSLVIQPGNAPTITVNSATPTTVGTSGTPVINWQTNQALYKYEIRIGSCSGTLATGTNVSLGDGSAQILAATTAVNTTLNNSNFSAGSNAVYICAYNVDGTLGQSLTTITKDLTAPTVTFSQLTPSTVTTGQTATAVWSANESGTYAVKVGSCSGSTVTGNNASGSYTTGSGTVSSVINAADLTDGTNTIYACVTDTAGNTGSATGSMLRDTTAPSAVSGVTLVDSDTTHDGIDGYDFTVSWTPASNDSTFSYYKIYLLQNGTALNTTTQSAVANVATQSTSTWTSTSTLTADSTSTAFSSGNYIAYVVAVDSVGLTSSSAASSAAAITLDDLAAPTFVSANTVDTNTVRLIFSEPISFVDTSKITATGLTIDTSYNANSYTNGYQINSTNNRYVFIRVTTISTGYTASNLALGACAVRDLTGSSNLNEAGSCTNTVPSTNANAAASNLSITDSIGPTLTLTSPAASGADNATIAISYSLSEAANSNSVQLKFTATGGTADSNSPHTVTISSSTSGISSLTGGTAEASGAHTATLAGGSFTSIERGATDTLVNGTIYTVALSASDTSSNAGITISNTSWTYDTTAPSAPVTTQAFSSPTANAAPTFDWSTVSGASSYTIEISLQSTNYSPTFATHSTSSTSWTISPAFATDGTADSTYVWRVFAVDAAGNTSAASNQNTFTLNTQTDTPSLILKDTTNNSQTYTNSTTVNATLDGYASDVLYYILSETQTTRPAIGTPGWTAVPAGGAPQTVSFTLSASEALKTVYVWVKDALDNISQIVSTANITLDTTAPGTPTLSAVDANAGANTGKTNAATVGITIGNDTGAAKWCTASGASGWTPVTPTESSCTTGVIGGSAASGWVTSRPTTHALASTGVRDMYVWTQDTAGNVSPASSAAILDCDTTVPPDPAISLTSQVTGSSSYTNSTTVNVSITNDATAWKWIISESQASLPAENSASWTSEPTTFTLSSGSGNKTVYIWVKNNYGTISANQISASITLDTAVPTFSTRKTQDLSDDGQIDAIQVTMSENILDSTITRGDFALGSSYTTNNLTGTLGSLTFTNGISTGSAADDSIFYIAVTQSGATDTGIKPTLTYTSGSLKDIAGNSTSSTGAVATTDGVVPRLTTTNPIRIYDTNGDGKSDQVKIIFSESLNSTTATTPWTLANVPSSSTLASSALGTTTLANDTITLTLTAGSGAADTALGSFTVALDNTSGAITDSSNSASSFTATAGSDYMGPVLVSANYVDTGTTSTSSIIATFSESVSDASLTLGDFTLASGGSLDSSTLSTGTTADDNTVVLTDLSSGAPTIGTSTLRLSGSGVVADTSTQANTSTGIATVIIRGGIVINEIQWAGMNSVATDQYIELRNMSASSAINFATDNHVLCRGTTTIASLTSGTLSANSFFLVSNLSQATSKINVAPDLVGFTNALLSGGTLSLTLRTGTSCSAGTLLDTAWNATAPSIGANNIALERNDSPGDGTSSSSWHAAVKTDTGFDDATTYKGTPKAANVADNTAPTFDTTTRFPDHQSLMPDSPASIKIGYADNTGGVGVNTASVTMEIDLNGDGDYADTNEGTSGYCSSGNLTVKTTTRVVCALPARLSAGKHSIRVTAADLAGNSAQTSWDFWVDNLTVSIQNINQANLGILTPGSGVATTNNSRHTLITVTTYGAGFTLTGTPNSVMTSGANTIGWHTNNTSTAGTGAAYRLKTGAAGSFGNYFNFNNQPAFVSVAKLTGAQLASTNSLQTYTYYVEYYVDVSATQQTGTYTNTINYTAGLTY